MKGGRRKMWNRKGASGDRVERLRAALGASDSPEEALLKRCAHFDLTGNSTSALQVGDQLACYDDHANALLYCTANGGIAAADFDVDLTSSSTPCRPAER